ncbi:CHY zinc finger protein [Halorubellus sp. PRR65]|uniref:CHY zinc finger protein n=1 Tax=Halorubellus sp. PRR65 TaxID=3098148 RepID=UPI002B2595D7|nr:CHY zinc finger protein [Halorubellus sp. PRR65]
MDEDVTVPSTADDTPPPSGNRDDRDTDVERCDRDSGVERATGRRTVGDREVFGVAVGPATRCAHYDTDRDVVAIRFACCERFYPCHACHDAVADHEATQWPRERFEELAVLCGACATGLSVATYLDCEHACPECGHAFNPGCAAHADRYFDV